MSVVEVLTIGASASTGTSTTVPAAVHWQRHIDGGFLIDGENDSATHVIKKPVDETVTAYSPIGRVLAHDRCLRRSLTPYATAPSSPRSFTFTWRLQLLRRSGR